MALESLPFEPSVQSATQVLIWLCQILIIGWPPMAWLKLSERDERSTKLWFGGLIVITLSAISVGLMRQANPFSGCVMVVGTAMFVEALRLEAGRQPTSWSRAAPLLALLLLAYLAIALLDLYPSFGVALTSFSLAFLEGTLLYIIYTVGRPMRSRGLVIVAAGTLPWFFINLVRLANVVAEGHAQALFAIAPMANAVVLSFTIFSLLATVGFLTYTYEKIHQRDLVALEEANGRLSLVATVDELTGLWNRRRFEEVVVTEMARADRHGLPLSLVIFDIDLFKAINDSHGHLVGDRVLVEMSDVARQVVRTSDLMFRWGGEEFLLVLPNTPLEGAAVLAEKLRARMAAHAVEGVGTVTASFGVATHEPGQSLAALMHRVDRALYEAKDGGRNLVKTAA